MLDQSRYGFKPFSYLISYHVAWNICFFHEISTRVALFSSLSSLPYFFSMFPYIHPNHSAFRFSFSFLNSLMHPDRVQYPINLASPYTTSAYLLVFFLIQCLSLFNSWFPSSVSLLMTSKAYVIQTQVYSEM